VAIPRTPGVGVRGWWTEVGGATLRHQRPKTRTGVAAAIVAVALATLAIYFLRRIAPVVSLSVVYLPAVLLISTYWGLILGLLTSLLSAASFNFFHIPPTGRFTIVDSRNWVALAAFMIVSVVASTIAELARSRALEAERRRAEADLAAALAHELLLGVDTGTALASAARRVAEALGLPSAAIEPYPAVAAAGDDRRQALPLRGIDGQQVATLLVPAQLPPDTDHRLRTQVVPTLEALVAIANRRDAMQAELVETAALRRSDDIKTALLRAVSHDLRTPLTAVVAAGHALGADSLTAQERTELSQAVVEEGTRLAGLVDNLLALSRLQAGSATPRSDWVSIEDLVSAAAEGLRGEPQEIRVTVDPDVPEVRADAAQLERAFANLLENAGRYGGGTPISVHARRAGDRVIVSVVDQGPGIAPAEQDRIFEPFYRGRGADARAWTGSGLGLAIVKGFVEANGGTISVQSLPGQGTSFQVSLPVAERSAGGTEIGAATGAGSMESAGSGG
jgi:two-component system sensor histidine kinase KdpD